ncbi:MAG: TatD family hydrolase [Bacteroidota bacterium]
MIDTHAHINTDEFAEDRDEMLRNAFHSGVEAVIIPATKPDEFDEIINLAQSRPELFCAIGVHPHHAAEIAPEDLDTVALRSSENKIVAIGEIGLDYYYDFSPKDIQQEVFRRQLRIAKETGLPAIIHNRESDDDLIRIIRDEQDGRLRGVLHCFSSPVGALREALDLGMHVSFTGNITFKNTDLAEQVTAAPLERIMIETDSPYMTPVPFRGRRNDPSRVGLVAEKIAEYKNISIDEVLEMTTKTAKKFFNLVIMLIMLALPSIAIAQDEGYQDDYYPC